MNIRKATMADIPALAIVHIDTWKATYNGIIADEIIEQLTYEIGENRFRTVLNMESQNVTCFVAEFPPKKILGFAIGGLERSGHSRYKGELWGIYVSMKSQGKGIGRQLVATVVTKLRNMNLNSMLVWVLKENPYRRFYESLGGQFVGEKPVKMGQHELIEVSYGWENLRELQNLLK